MVIVGTLEGKELQKAQQKCHPSNHDLYLSTNSLSVYQAQIPLDSYSKGLGRNFDALQSYKPRLYCQPVIRRLPNAEWVKCNTDGAYRGNLGQSSYAFWVRNNQGNIIYTEARWMGVMTYMQVETKAILHGLIHCYGTGLDIIIIETDSLVLQKILIKEQRKPWCIREDMETIHQMATNMNIRYVHNYRKTNQLTYKLTNIALTVVGVSV